MMTAGELASYYRAAVEYIDPRLREDCPVEDIRAAAAARKLALEAHDSSTARLELEKIEEALQFISRIHPDLIDPAPSAAAPDGSSGPADGQLPPAPEEVAIGAASSTASSPEDHPELASPAALPSEAPDPDRGNEGFDRKAFRDERRKRQDDELDSSRELADEIEQELHTHERVDRIIGSLPDTSEAIARELEDFGEGESGTVDFRSLMERARSATSVAIRPARTRRLRTGEILSRERPQRRIPEEQAAPILLGILLILWQAAASVLAGYAVCRLLAWPFGSEITSIAPMRLLIAFLLGIGTAALTGLWFRSYRRSSHRLSLPTHVTAGSAFLVLLCWQLQAASTSKAGPPPIWLWCLFFACWIVAAIAVAIHDLRVPPVMTADEEQEIGTEPAGHLQG